MDLLLEWEAAIMVWIEKLDQLKAFKLSRAKTLVLSQEVKYLTVVNIAGPITVKALEGRKRGEIPDRAKLLPQVFKVTLAFAHCDKQVFQPVLWFISKHLLKIN